jgi:hypothetical protein
MSGSLKVVMFGVDDGIGELGIDDPVGADVAVHAASESAVARIPVTTRVERVNDI